MADGDLFAADPTQELDPCFTLSTASVQFGKLSLLDSEAGDIVHEAKETPAPQGPLLRTTTLRAWGSLVLNCYEDRTATVTQESQSSGDVSEELVAVQAAPLSTDGNFAELTKSLERLPIAPSEFAATSLHPVAAAALCACRRNVPMTLSATDMAFLVACLRVSYSGSKRTLPSETTSAVLLELLSRGDLVPVLPNPSAVETVWSLVRPQVGDKGMALLNVRLIGRKDEWYYLLQVIEANEGLKRWRDEARALLGLITETLGEGRDLVTFTRELPFLELHKDDTFSGLINYLLPAAITSAVTCRPIYDLPRTDRSCPPPLIMKSLLVPNYVLLMGFAGVLEDTCAPVFVARIMHRIKEQRDVIEPPPLPAIVVKETPVGKVTEAVGRIRIVRNPGTDCRFM